MKSKQKKIEKMNYKEAVLWLQDIGARNSDDYTPLTELEREEYLQLKINEIIERVNEE